MNPKKFWLLTGGLGSLSAIAAGALIYFEMEEIEALRIEAANVQVEIANGRELIAKTATLEKEVIIQRETESVIATILPSDDDINNFVRTLRNFEEASGVRITEVKKKDSRSTDKTKDFTRVQYGLKFDGNIFELLTFMSQVDNHPRFMSIPGFRLSAARGKRKDEEPRHTIQMDVETYVYESKDAAQAVKVDGYDRKKALLQSEIGSRTAELAIHGYEYAGARGRRDPFVDPRVPVPTDPDVEVLSIEEQILLVDDLVERAEHCEELWETYKRAENLIADMKARSELEISMAELEEEMNRVAEKQQLVFVSAERRFNNDVVARVAKLRSKLNNSEGLVGPSVEVLNETIATLNNHLDAHEYELARRVSESIEPRLPLAERDPNRGPLVEQIRWMGHLAQTVLEFDEIEMDIAGIGLIEGLKPVAVINGESLAEGEMVAEDLFIRAIGEYEIEFVFRGVILGRRLQP